MTLDRLAKGIADKFAPVLQVLSDTGTQMRALRDVGFFGSEHLEEMSRQFEGVARRALAHLDVVVGVGAVWESGTGAPEMLWWRADGGVVTRKTHVDNPESDSFYDFTHLEWYERALQTADVVIAGPYIDAWGTDEHALTPSQAVHAGGVRLGVAALDLDLDRGVEAITTTIGQSPDIVVANGADRVVAADLPSLTPGLLMQPYLTRNGLRVAEECGVPGIPDWRLLRLSH